MHAIDTDGHVNNEFDPGDPLQGRKATIVDALWLNAVQNEILAVLAAAGVTPVKGTNNQLLASILSKVGGTLTGNLTLNHAALASVLTLLGQGDAAIELGRIDGNASSPFIDFHSGATPVDYDARLVTTGGSGSNAGGELNILASALKFNDTDVVTRGTYPDYESGEQTIVDGTRITLAHGIGPSIPRELSVYAVCKTAEHNYLVNQETPLFGHTAIVVGGVVSETGVSISADGTNVYLTISQDPIHVYNQTTGVMSQITNANWRLIARANV